MLCDKVMLVILSGLKDQDPLGSTPFARSTGETECFVHLIQNEMVKVTTCVVSPVASPWHCHGIYMVMPQGLPHM